MTFLDAKDFKGPIRVTLVYFIMYYVFLYLGAFYKLGKGVSTLIIKKPASDGGSLNNPLASSSVESGNVAKGNVEEENVATIREKRILLTIERTQGNTLEQMPVFLTVLWLTTFFVSGDVAEDYGAAYIAFRFIYPICFYFGLPWILISTWPGYIIIFSMLGKVVRNACLSGDSSCSN